MDAKNGTQIALDLQDGKAEEWFLSFYSFWLGSVENLPDFDWELFALYVLPLLQIVKNTNLACKLEVLD